MKRVSAFQLMSLLASVLAAGQVQIASAKPTSDEDLQNAEMVAHLIQQGHLQVDPKTGELSVKSSIVDILEENGVVKDTELKKLEMAGSCAKTNGC